MKGNSSSFNMTDNDTLTCAARNIQGAVELSINPYVTLVARCLLVTYYMLVAFFGTVLNCFVFYLVCRYKVLHTISFVFAIQNIVCNIIGSVLVTISFASVLANQWLLGYQMCILIGGLYLLIYLVRAFLLFGLVLDRFCSVFLTFSYPHYQVKLLWCFGIISYLIPAIVVTFFGVYDCFIFSITAWICRLSSSCSPQCSLIRQISGATVFFPISCVPVILYFALYCKGRRIRNAMRTLARTSASETQKEMKDHRASVTFFLMFLSLFLVSTPAGVTSIVANMAGSATDTTESVWFYIVEVISTNIFILAHVADPVFILRNKDVREVIFQITWLPFLKMQRNRRPY